jgi:UDP-glucuronate 4-epimerase
MRILVTGAAGFIGFYTVKKYLEEGHEVIGLDNLNGYYDTQLKYDRLMESGIAKSEILYNKVVESSVNRNYGFFKLNLEDTDAILNLFNLYNFDLVIHLAAQAGVRYSLENPSSYIQSNVVGFLNILEGCRHSSVDKLIYASSSSVYGMSDKDLLSTKDRVDNPVSLYAATKKSNELMAHVYSHLYHFKTVGLRFFTVYGPWGRPDMAPCLFADAIIRKQPIKIFNHGLMKRDFTFIDDIISGIFGVSQAEIRESYSVFNIGNSKPVELMYFIECMEKSFNTIAIKQMEKMQPGDVKSTWADTSELGELTGYRPQINIEEGVKIFADWYKKYYLGTSSS